MGDVTNEVISILKQDIQGNIEYFKLPHHGTKDISILNFRASKFIVSISDGRHYNRYSYKPIHMNNLVKALKDNTVILCTDGHRNCEMPIYTCYLPYSCRGIYCNINSVVRVSL